MENPMHLLRFSGKKRLPVILQTEAAECGLASLAMVAAYHGYKTDLTTLRQSHDISLKGAKLEELMQIADKLNLSTRALRLELEHLPKLKTPCILHWDMNHFVVLKAVNRDSVVIHDPALGERKYTKGELSKHFTGVALELSPTEEFKSEDTRVNLKLSDFWRKVTGLKSTLGKVFLLSLLLQAFAITSPYYMQLVVDEVILSYDHNLLTILAVGFGLLMLIEMVTGAVRSILLLHFGNLMSVQLGANLFHHLIRLPLQYFEKRHIGDVVSRFGSLQQVKELLTKGVIEALIDGIMAIATLVMIFIYSPQLSFIVITAAAIYAIVRIAMYKPLRRMSEEVIVTQAKEQSNFMETVRGIQTIKLFGREVQRQSTWHNKYADNLNAGIKVGHLNIGYEAINRVIFGLENVLVIYFAALLVMEGNLSVGMLFAFMAYKRQFVEKMASLIEKVIEFKMLSLHFNRLADISLTNKESDIQSKTTAKELSGRIEVKDLKFRYSKKEAPVFSALDLSIQAGESVAIVGASGSGKTTLAKVMLGLFEPEAGKVEVDGVDIRQLGLSQYRSQIAAVMQDDQLLSGSIADNISFFDPDLDMKKVEWAAQVAAIDTDIVSMNMGYNTLVGDMGAALSGGQIQRLLLARALYRKPKILFMDEATSNLDTRLEASVNNAVKDLDITRIIIAHRPETIASADRVLALRYGKVVEEEVPNIEDRLSKKPAFDKTIKDSEYSDTSASGDFVLT
ncbi:peptidase domain-containing ABC transporter [Pseudoalteromonas luteoviolacea]|uniref:ABC transporter n=1 Tax=Pseudoalteromonas luteoviolacea S4054 TaxID=1129367 RepID=A0A0F6AH57_9GAMM|nr:peptidase domain-containing ABC transporter [Pseudoalteromonas luteoviolacea]AOT10078.1 ABC transporter ATP-binding protein [Pseudoalteromonas luteoviolacea]AOT14989.1 ABC transporter ATP-binding protein [Pseudoalteromonas luteoviolacea]AOT19905.1 ABC transporter ATP-binding protein [Pseudoalteromonas luteoviolacea]KKE85483.1 ABC transporter [Pseudoalteromonas luteoviolacea S4054]KZN68601.1 ABC transporter [Pseudoalteromonas luteoviolacea S4047-1]